jgi:molybdopterin-containing oxidoreductase family iron-sulfur binding subunit
VASTRLSVDGSRMAQLAAALAARLGAAGESPTELNSGETRWVESAARELDAARGRSLMAVGAQLAPAIQALAPTLNERLGNVGQTVWYSDPILVPTQGGSLPDLARDIAAGSVDALVILDANPVYASPADLRLPELLPQVRDRIHLGLHHDETAALCTWHLPLAHALESFADARAVDGTASIIQPVVSARSIPLPLSRYRIPGGTRSAPISRSAGERRCTTGSSPARRRCRWR